MNHTDNYSVVRKLLLAGATVNTITKVKSEVTHAYYIGPVNSLALPFLPLLPPSSYMAEFQLKG